ncbi:hypothetical protein, partial [Streptomyces sp. NPDC056154]|uniref:hypothetical protein n=1 Tax=unclassified Streptomyces TaxID=2593676 RepID=UPI0035DBFA36
HSVGRHRRRHSTSNYDHSNKPVLRRSIESALASTVRVHNAAGFQTASAVRHLQRVDDRARTMLVGHRLWGATVTDQKYPHKPDVEIDADVLASDGKNRPLLTDCRWSIGSRARARTGWYTRTPYRQHLPVRHGIRQRRTRHPQLTAQ